MKLKTWLPLIIVFGLLAAGLASGLHEQLSLTNILQQRATLRSFIDENLLVALLSYAALYVVLVAISFPGGLALTIASGFLFGALLGGLATVIGATIGATVIFLIARSSFGDLLQEKAGSFVKRMTKGFQEDAFQYLLTLRLIPAFPFWVVNIVPGLLKMKLLPYMVATFFGIIPGTFVFAYLGAGLDSIIEEQELANPGCIDAGTCSIDPKALVTTDILLALLLLGVLSLAPFVFKKFFRSKTAGTSVEDPQT